MNHMLLLIECKYCTCICYTKLLKQNLLHIATPFNFSKVCRHTSFLIRIYIKADSIHETTPMCCTGRIQGRKFKQGMSIVPPRGGSRISEGGGGANMDIYICSKIADTTSVRSMLYLRGLGAFPHRKSWQIWPIEIEFGSNFN